MVLALLAAVPGVGRPGTVFGFETPTVTVTPGSGAAGTVIEVRYRWPGCGSIPAGDYVLELYWDSTANPLASTPFTYPGSGDCDLTVQTAVPTGASPGGHDVIALVRDQKDELVGFSDVKGGITVTDQKATPDPKETPKPARTPSTEPTSGPKEPLKPSAEPTVDSGKPTPDAGETSGPDGTDGEPLPTPGLQPVGPPPASLPPGTEIMPVAELVDEDDSVMAMVGRIATDAGHVASDLIVGGMTAAMMAMDRGINPFPAPWSRGPNLSNSAGEAVDPDVAATDSSVYVVWADSASGQWEVMFARSNDHGYSFEEPVNLSSNAGASQHPKVVADGQRITVTWDDNTRGLTSVYTIRSYNGGGIWSEPSYVGIGARPVIASGGGSEYLAWTGGLFGDQIFAARVAGPVSQVTTNSDANRNPVIAASSSNVSIAWETNFVPVWEVAYAGSWDQAATWRTNGIPPDSVYPGPRDGRLRSCFSQGGDYTLPAIAIDGRMVLLGAEWLHYAHLHRSLDDGREWIGSAHRCETYRLLSARAAWNGPRVRPSLAASAGQACIAYPWHDLSTTSGLVATCWTGDQAGQPRSIREAAFQALDLPVIRFAGSRVAVAWQERTPGRPFDVWLNVLGGSSQNLSSSGGDSTVPRLASSSSNVTVVWTESSNGNRQVYFRTVPAR